MTLSAAIREGQKRGIYAWELRSKTDSGLVKFYIHGMGKDSVTLDFTLDVSVSGVELLIADPQNEQVQWAPERSAK